MSTKNSNRSRSSRKSTTNKVKRALPKFISYNTGNSYRVRKTTNGQHFDKTFNTLKDAKAMAKMMS